MANNNNDVVNSSPDNAHDSGLDQSFVGKFMSGLLSNTPLSKWFGKESPKSRKRTDQDEDEPFSLQPPSKRAKLPHNSHQTPQSSNNVRNVFYNFPEPVPGPSGLNLRPMPSNTYSGSTLTMSSQDHILNGRDSDSSGEESTSGYSSQLKRMDKVSDKSINTNKNISFNEKTLFDSTAEETNTTRSLFTDRSLTQRHINTSSSSSLSSRRPTFNATTFGSPNFVDKTLSTQQILNSPFYNGRTTYCGASAYGRKLGRNLEQQTSILRNNSIQIKPKNQIKENTTLSKTARRILTTLEQYGGPINDAKKIPSTPKRIRTEGLLSKYTGANPYLVKRNEKKACSSNRELQVPSIPELIKMKEKERLQNITESVRQIATKSSLNKQEYKLRNIDNNNKEQAKHTNKMKSSITSSIRQKNSSNVESVPEVNLPQIPLPITTLPKFNFSIAPPSIDKEINQTIIKEVIKTDVEKPIEYKFSNPLIIVENLKKSIIAVNNFKFSEPLSKKPKRTTDELKHRNNGEFAKVSEIKKDGILEKFKPVEGTWECSTCLVRNQSDKIKCVACEMPKNKLQTQAKSTFGSQFKLNDKWECDSCLVRNNMNDTKCVACNTAKVAGFGETMKPASDTWKCGTCLIRNNSNVEKCVACEMPKISQTIEKVADFGGKFRPAQDTWECTVCMIRNKNNATKCAACETAKPGNGHLSEVGFGDQFKMTPDNWECCSCLVRNTNDTLTCQCCGVPKPSACKQPEIAQNKSMLTFNFGINKTNEFKFGIPASLAQKSEATTSAAASVFGNTAKKPDEPVAGFSFGIKSSDTSNPLLKPNEKLPEKAEVAPANFKFTVPKKVATDIKDVPKFDFKPVNGDSKSDEKLPTLFSKPVTTQIVSFNFQPATTTTATFKFGGVEQTNATNGFGTAGASEKPFVFDNGEQVTNKTFTFSGQSDNCLTSSTSTTSTTTPTTTTTTSFKFGSSAATSNVPNFNFAPNFNFTGSDKGETSSTSSGFSSSENNANKNGVFNFGSSMTNNNNQKAVFSFGASQTNNVAPVPPASQSGFNFGSTSLPQTGGFNFSGPPPSFNFSDGANAAQSGPHRKIRKALRRTHR